MPAQRRRSRPPSHWLMNSTKAVTAASSSGGAAAIAEEQAGRTQRVVTVERLAQVIRQELSAPQRNEMIISRLQTAPAPLAD